MAQTKAMTNPKGG